MTAPDPGLTDLVAAHQWIHFAQRRNSKCACGWQGDDPDYPSVGHPAHVTEVLAASYIVIELPETGGSETCTSPAQSVEQHTNGRHEWPKTTPTGFTYERPTTYAALEHMIGHMVQSEIECWDEPERPPEPVWEMIGIAQQEVGRERARAEKAEAKATELEARVDEWRAEYRKVVQPRDDWRARAEKAEATIARVRNALPNIEGINPASSHYDKGWDRGQQILTEHIQSAITGDYSPAALEGES